MNFTLKIWRQKDAKTKGGFETYKVENISADTSFLEMLDNKSRPISNQATEQTALVIPPIKERRDFLHGTLHLLL